VNEPLTIRAGIFVWVIEPSQHGVALYQFGPDGSVGDTWHPDVEDAKAQAAYFMDVANLAPWKRVPEGVTDLQTYGREQAKNSDLDTTQT
jgi:hypothetical protein